MTKRELCQIESKVKKVRELLSQADGMVSALVDLFVFKGFEGYETPRCGYASNLDVSFVFDKDGETWELEIEEAIDMMKKVGYITPEDFRY